MPAVKKVSREEIIDAAVEVLCDGGFSSVNARSVAKKLGCSTQPIYFSFKNMDELKAALTERAIRMHTQRVRDSLLAHEGNDSRYSSYGMGLVKFAAEEKQLFRWLYLDGEQTGPYSNDVLLNETVQTITDEFGYDEETAKKFHQDMIYFSYGLAILANTDHLYLTEKELREAFRREFRALISIYGKPTRLPEFAVKAGGGAVNMKLFFSWVGLVVFALPMLINVAYAIFPPTGDVGEVKNVTKWVEVIENVSRIVYLVLMVFLVNKDAPHYLNAWFVFAVIFLILYYMVWIRYFIGKRNVALLAKPFLFVPIPLAIFPVLYYLFAAIWVGNYPAAIVMLIFGAAHITVSVQSFH